LFLTFPFSTIRPSLAGSCCGPIAGSVCLALPLLSPPEIPIHASLGSLRILSSESLTSLDALSLRNHSRLHQPKAAFSKCTDFGRIRSTPGGGCLLLLLSLLPLLLLLLLLLTYLHSAFLHDLFLLATTCCKLQLPPLLLLLLLLLLFHLFHLFLPFSPSCTFPVLCHYSLLSHFR
jgi:hypothetical protein